MYDKLGDLRSAVADWKPDVVFNLLEEFQGIAAYDQHVVAYLELLRQPYTGCNPRGLLISRDKVLSKQILSITASRRRNSPCSAAAALSNTRQTQYPLFVKSNTEDASLGISQASIVRDRQKLKERIEFIHEQPAAMLWSKNTWRAANSTSACWAMNN